MGSSIRIALAALALSAVAAPAQEFPSKPITIVLPLGAGGAMDIVLRSSLAPKLAERLGKPVVVENRTGGGTVIGANQVAKSAPDGHTILFAPAGTLTTNAALYKALPYDPGKDFTPVALTSKVGFVLVANPAVPAKNIKELIAYAKANPGKLSFASPGIGSTPQLAVEMIKAAAGIQLTHVPYKGSPPALNDVVAGHVQMTFTDPAISPQLIKDGKVRAIGVSSLSRVGVLPDVPTLAESGLPDYEAVSWHMLAVPAATPKPIVERLNAEFKAIMALPEVKKQITDIGLIPMEPGTVAAMQAFLHDEIGRWGKLVQQAGIAGSQ